MLFGTYKIINHIRLIELFAGIGSQAMALRDIGADFEHYRVVEFDKYAIKSYNAIHGTNFEPMDIRDIKGEDLGVVDTDEHTYILTYSFPCFTADTLVLTNRGLVAIKDVKEGDKVLTHDNTYQTVLCSKKTGHKNVYMISGQGVDALKCTENHKFYVREMYRTYPTYENGKRGSIRHFRKPQWKECREITKKDYLGIAINQNSIMPTWNGITFHWADGRKDRCKNELSLLLTNHSFWWIIGRYIGDGWERQQGGIIICCEKTETQEIIPHLEKCNFNYTLVKERTATKIHIPIKELSLFTAQFGKYAYGKFIPDFMFDMPVEYLKSFLDGYISADGYQQEKLTKITSVSKKLIYGVAQLIAKVYKTPYRIYKIKRNPVVFIEGRKCAQKDCWTVVYKTEKCKQDKAFYENGFIWFPIKSIENLNKEEDVYDLTVENNHSFTANGVIVHNCQDLSLAGKRQGMTKGSGTRSGLLWEVERLLNETENIPQILLMENVPQVHSKKNIADFNLWIDFLISKGYSNFWQDLNAKDYGVAQNRKRCFMISILGNAIYEFPKPVKLTKCMKAYLEDKVDERYYIKSERAYKLILDLQEREVLKDKERVTCDMTIRAPREIDVMNCIKARYNQGVVNRPKEGGGVIERVQQLGNFTESKRNNPNTNRVYDKNALSPALNTMQGGNRQPMIVDNLLLMGYKIRKLTPCECWRLMGFSDEDLEKAQAVNSNTQLYKQAGNSIVKDVLMAIFRQMI